MREGYVFTLQGLFGRAADKMGDTFSKFGGWGGSKVGYVLQVRDAMLAV